MKIDLSIIVPIYNVEQYLEECLDTIYKLKINKEVILVNDESPDNSKFIIERYKKLYPEETIVINQKNKGLSGARNSGLKKARGEYTSFIDSDDFINIKKYEEFFKEGKSRKLDIMIGNYRQYKDGIFLEVCKRDIQLKNLGVVTGKVFFEKSIQLESFREEVWDDIYNTNFLKENNLFFKEKLLHEDTLFFIQALNKAKRVEYRDIDFYIYRQREGSIMSSFSYKNQRHRIFIIEEFLKLQKEKKINFKFLNSYLLKILWVVFRTQNEVNLKIIYSLIKNERYSLKEYLKIIIMIISKVNCKTIKSIDL